MEIKIFIFIENFNQCFQIFYDMNQHQESNRYTVVLDANYISVHIFFIYIILNVFGAHSLL